MAFLADTATEEFLFREMGVPMQRRDLYGFLCCLVVCCVWLFGVQAFAASNFNISATNVTMPGRGNLGTSSFTLTSVNSYTGQVTVTCDYSGGEMNARVPVCGIFTDPYFTLGANQTVKGSLTLVPYGKTIAFSANRGAGVSLLRGSALAGGLAGLVIVGWRLRSKAGQFLALIILGFSVISSLTACGNSLSGTFPYTVTAVDTRTNTTASTSINVTCLKVKPAIESRPVPTPSS